MGTCVKQIIEGKQVTALEFFAFLLAEILLVLETNFFLKNFIILFQKSHGQSDDDKHNTDKQAGAESRQAQICNALQLQSCGVSFFGLIASKPF